MPATVTLPMDVVRRVFDYAQKADHAGLLGECGEHLNPEGACVVCADFEAVQLALMGSGATG